jgi:hypothetical protein
MVKKYLYRKHVIQMSEPKDYTGGDFGVFLPCNTKILDLLVLPHYTGFEWHRVTIESGTRRG